MSKPNQPMQATVFCGIDVSALTLAVAVHEQDRPLERREFGNDAAGHKALIAWLGRRKARARVSLEATGIYSLDLALALAQISTLQLMGELISLPAGMTVRQWVAQSGLDPAHEVSGSSLHKPSRISRAGNKHLRRAPLHAGVVASRRDPHLKAFYESLLARHKARLQALVAVARKLLHAIYGILHTQTTYDGAKLFPQFIPTS